MNDPDRKSFLHVSWPEIAIAAVLTAILVAVIVLHLAGGSRAATTRTDRSPADGGPSKREVPPVAVVDPADVEARDRWQPASPHGVIAYDPFRVPAAFLTAAEREAAESAAADQREEEQDEQAALLEAARAAREAAFERLSEQGFNAFLDGGEDGNVAVIGTQTIRVGDVVAGFRVVAIEPDGVVVEPVE